MDAVERQNAVFQRRERRLAYCIATFCAFLLLATIVGTAEATESTPDYIKGVNVMPCRAAVKNPLSGQIVADCRASGEYTPHRVEAIVVAENGREYVSLVQATLLVRCSQQYCYTIEDRDGTPKGTMVGQSKVGNYMLEVGWYMSLDSTGVATAYREDVGPMRNNPPYVYNCVEYNECE